jgi:hypothetical protein
LSHSLWAQFNVVESGIPVERFANAGLSTNGQLCFACDIDETEYCIWNIETETILWSSVGSDLDHRLLADWAKDGHIQIDQGAAAESYRLFGVFMDYPLLSSDALEITLPIDEMSAEIILRDKLSHREFQRLKYKAFSFDWAFATFSDDFSTIAVIEPYYITFFRKLI